MSLCNELLKKLNLTVAIILSPSNTFYFSGYRSSNCQIVITEDKNYFITDMRYAEEAKSQIGDEFEVIVGDFNAIKTLVGNAKNIGWDDDVPYGTYKKIVECFGNAPFEKRNLVAIGDTILEMRDIKNSSEIGKIIGAQAITDKAFTEILPFIKEGISEIELAARLEYIMLKSGAELAFDSIVAFGSNGSKPHAHRSTKKLAQGEFVTMDFGAKYQGYCSDCTRTVALGNVSEKQAKVYETVRLAQQTALDNIKSGMSGQSCDKIAREFIKNSGYDGYFSHSLGHGLGIDIHEGTGLTPSTEKLICPNMVVSVEPGIYIQGQFGVRIEDIVVIKNNGVEDLTQSNKNLIIL